MHIIYSNLKNIFLFNFYCCSDYYCDSYHRAYYDDIKYNFGGGADSGLIYGDYTGDGDGYGDGYDNGDGFIIGKNLIFTEK